VRLHRQLALFVIGAILSFGAIRRLVPYLLLHFTSLSGVEVKVYIQSELGEIPGGSGFWKFLGACALFSSCIH